MSIENELNTIAVHLGRIALALEKLTDAPAPQTPVASPPAPTTPPLATVPMGGPPTDTPPGVPVTEGALGDPPTTAPPPAALGAGVPTGTTGPVVGVPNPIAPAMSPPAPAPQVQGVPTLDDIKALANDFHRAHPDKVGEFVQKLAEKGAQKLSDLPPASYPEIFGFLKEHMG